MSDVVRPEDIGVVLTSEIIAKRKRIANISTWVMDILFAVFVALVIIKTFFVTSEAAKEAMDFYIAFNFPVFCVTLVASWYVCVSNCGGLDAISEISVRDCTTVIEILDAHPELEYLRERIANMDRKLVNAELDVLVAYHEEHSEPDDTDHDENCRLLYGLHR